MVDLSVEFVYMWVSWVRGAVSIAFSNESLDHVGEVGRHVKDVTLGDVVFWEEVKGFTELGLSRAAGGM